MKEGLVAAFSQKGEEPTSPLVPIVVIPSQGCSALDPQSRPVRNKSPRANQLATSHIPWSEDNIRAMNI